MLLHEIGHAYIHLFELPITGLEEDAADQFATLTAVFLEDPWLAYAGAILLRALAEGRGTICSEDVWDEHALHEQRETNIRCWLYGYDPFTFTFIPASFPEATGRLQQCGAEYQQTETAWETLLAPHSNTEPGGQGLGYSRQGAPARGEQRPRRAPWPQLVEG